MMVPDLNLLRMFLVLWDERSVSRAAEHVHVTQSAMSHILKRLRLMLGDPLFRRGPRGLEPTAYAVEIEPRLRSALHRIPVALERSIFEPALSARSFMIAAGPYICELLVPSILAHVSARAPHVDIGVIRHGPRLLEQLELGAVDLAIGCFDRWPAGIMAMSLFREEMVWVARRESPLPDPLSEYRLGAMRRVEVRTAEIGDPAGPRIDRSPLQARTGLGPADPSSPLVPPDPPARPAHAIVYDNRTALEVIATTDLVGILPRRLVEARAEERGVRILRPEDGTPTALEISMLWSREQDRVPSYQWLRTLIHGCVRDLEA